jgi:hypothetical protein
VGLAAAEPRAREERKVVTVLFANLVGFTSRAELMDPKDVRAPLPGWRRVCASGWPPGGPADYTGTAMTGVVVGPEVPPAGSTVIPIRSPGTTPEASTGPAHPVPESSPAERAPSGPITHSW